MSVRLFGPDHPLASVMAGVPPVIHLIEYASISGCLYLITPYLAVSPGNYSCQ
jgi:hypothetical protein